MKSPEPRIAMRKRDSQEIMDLALLVLKQWWKQLLPAMVMGALPFLLFSRWESQLPMDETVGVFEWCFLLLLFAPWASAPVEIVLGRLMFSQPLSIVEIIKQLFSRPFSMLFYQGFLRFFCILFGVTLIFLPNFLGFVNEIIYLERTPFRGVRKRQSALAYKADLIGLNFQILYFSLIFITAGTIGLSTLLSVLKSSDMWEQPEWPGIIDWKIQLFTWSSMQFFAIVRFLNYLDTRIKAEGWDLEHRVRLLLESRGPRA